MMNERGLRVLSALDSSKSRQDIADDLNYRDDTISKALNRLEQLGLVHKERRGNRVVFHPSDARCTEVLHSLTKSNPHVDVPDLLTSSMLDLLYYLNSETPWTARKLAERTGYARATIYRNLRTLTNRAMAIKDHSQYRLTEDFDELHAFAYELRHYVHYDRIKQDVGSGTLVWESHDEFLVRTQTDVDMPNYHRTGLDAFEAYGLQFFTTSEQYYLHSSDRDSLTPDDLVCHLLLIENDSRHQKYALLLVSKTDHSHERLEETASYYGVAETVSGLLEFLQTHGESSPDGTLQWDAFKSLAAEYGVEL